MPRRLVQSLGACLGLLAAFLAFGAAQASAAGTITVAVNGKGDVTGDGISCSESGGDCSEFVPEECESNPDPPPAQFCASGSITVTAGADRSGYEFQSWTGCGSVDARDCSVVANMNKTVTATFADTTPPSVTVSPSGGVLRGTFTIASSAGDTTGIDRVEFRVRGALVGTDTSAPYGANVNSTALALADGPAVLRASAFASSGQSAFAESTVTIDNTAPTVGITSGPDGQAFGPGTTQEWDLAAGDATSGVASVQCSVVAEGLAPSFGSCSGGTTSHSVSDRPEGDYTFTVRATDNGGLQTTASRSFSIDATPPDTTITGGPKKRTTRKRATFLFTSNEAATFQCRLDGGAWRSCSSPASFRVGTGRHRLQVRARDAVGHQDPTAAAYAWKVRRKRR